MACTVGFSPIENFRKATPAAERAASLATLYAKSQENEFFCKAGRPEYDFDRQDVE